MSKRLRYYVSLIMVISFCLGIFSPGFASEVQSPLELKDISDHWAKDTITKWLNEGFITGYSDGTFRPDNSITRAEFMALVNRAFGFSEKAAIRFSDVSANDWFHDEIAKAVKAGYISGYQDGTVKPNQAISRQEAAIALCKALNLELQNNVNQFTDKDSIPSWSRPYIGALAAKGYMGGYPDGSFRPERQITRAETVTMLDNALKALAVTYDEPGIYGPEEGIETISKDVAINAPDVTLRNMVIEGNLYLNEGIGEGDVNLENVTVKGETIIRGGGEDSIHLVNFTCEEVIVIKVGGRVRIVASGNTNISEIKLQSGAIVEGEGIETITILKAGEEIILDGDFEEVIIDADVKLEVLEGTTINKLEINSKAQVDLASNTTVKHLTLEAAATIAGKGTIEYAKINADDTELKVEPKNYDIAEGVKTKIAGKEVAGGKEEKTPSSGGGGGGSKPSVIRVESVSLDRSTVTLAVYEEGYQEATLTATIYPDNASNKNVRWSSSDDNIATVIPNGLNATVKAAGVGVAEITVTTEDRSKTATCVVTVVYGLPEQSTYKIRYEDLADSYTVGNLVDVAGKNQEQINSSVKEAVEGIKPIKVTLFTELLGKTGYEAVRILPIGAGENIQLWAKDSKGNWHDINVSGWGQPSGFELPADYTATKEVYVLSDKAGDYELTVQLVDLKDDNKVIAENVETIVVIEEPREPEITGEIKIISVEPNEDLVPGEEYEFTVVVNYEFDGIDKAVLYIGFNNGDKVNSYNLVDEGDYVVDEKVGSHTFNVRARVKDWGDEGDFEVYVNISEYRHDDKWSPISFDTKALGIKSSPEEMKADKTALRAKVDEAADLQEANYTPESWEVFAQALESALAVLNDDEATQAEVDSALAELNAAIEALETVKRATEMKGVVIDEEQNYIKHVVVWVTKESEPHTLWSTYTNENGEFIITDGNIGFGDGTYTVKTFELGYEVGVETVVVSGGKIPEIKIELKQAQNTVNVSGRVTSKGAPVDNAIVTIDIANDGFGYSVTTDEDGYYKVEGIPAGTYGIRIYKLGYDTLMQNIDIKSNNDNVNFDLKKSTVIKGVVVDENQNPIIDARVWVIVEAINYTYATYTNQNGEFSLRGHVDIPSGTYTVRAFAPDYNVGEASIEVSEGDWTENIIIELIRANETGNLSGKVMSNGAAVEGATVGIDVAGDGFGYGYETKTNIRGEYELKGIPAGEYNVIVYKDGYEFHRESITVGQGNNSKDFTLQSENS